MLVLSSQARLLGSNPVVWLCDQEPVRSFQKGPPPEKAKLRRWWTYLSQLRLTVHHIQGVKNECADYISRNNFDALIGARSEALAKEAFSCMDVHLIIKQCHPKKPLACQYLQEAPPIIPAGQGEELVERTYFMASHCSYCGTAGAALLPAHRGTSLHTSAPSTH